MSESSVSSPGTNALPLITKARAVPDQITTFGADIPWTRPNDTTAYITGDVFADGALADGRLHIGPLVAPATGVAGTSYYLSGVQFGVQRTGANLVIGSPAMGIGGIMFSAQPATVIADNAPLALSDADLALIIRPSNNQPFTISFGPSQASNYGPAGKIRFGSSVTPSMAADVAGVGNVPTSFPLEWWMYWFLTGAFVPTAQEVLTFKPRYTWSVVPT